MSYELSEKQINETITSFKNSFEKWAVFRRIFNVEYIDENSTELKKDYVTIGFNHIMERKWFSDYTGPTYYDHNTLGTTRGKGVASGESRYILSKINEIVESLDISILVEKPDLVKSVFRTIRSNQDYDLVILVNPKLMFNFMNDENFRYINRADIWGYYYDVPVVWSLEVQNGSVYMINRDAGVIKVLLDSTLEISEIDVSEYDKILKDIDTMTIDDLPLMVRVIAKETIKFDLKDHRPLIVRKMTVEN